MKKSILVIAALFAAFSINAKEIVIDLNTATEMAYDGCTATPSVADGVLTVNYMTPAGWLWAGVEFPVDNVEGLISLDFDFQGTGEGIVLYPYVRDAEGARWTKGEYWITLEETSWGSESIVPDALLWDAADYELASKAVTAVGFIANPGSATTSSFALRNVKLIVPDDEETALDNVATQSMVVKVVRGGQVLFIRDGKTFNALGAEVK